MTETSASLARTSDLLAEIVRSGNAPTISVREIVAGLGDRAFGLGILIFALPNCIPGPPGVGSALAIPPLLFAIQMLYGRHRPALPEWLNRRSADRARLARTLDWMRPKMAWIERICRPRWPALTEGRGERWVAAWLLVLSATVLIPLPLTNMFPSIATAIIAVGLIERDGVTVAIGCALGVPALAVALTSCVLILKGTLMAAALF